MNKRRYEIWVSALVICGLLPFLVLKVLHGPLGVVIFCGYILLVPSVFGRVLDSALLPDQIDLRDTVVALISELRMIRRTMSELERSLESTHTAMHDCSSAYATRRREIYHALAEKVKTYPYLDSDIDAPLLDLYEKLTGSAAHTLH